MDNPKEQFKAGILPERTLLNKTALICLFAMIILPLVAVIVLVCVLRLFALFVVVGVLVIIYLAVFIPWNAKVCKLEEKTQMEKFLKMVSGMIDQDEYELPIMDYDFTIKVNKTGFVIDGEEFGFDNFDVFLGTTNLCRQASVAFFVTSNFSPFSDDKTYPINFGIVCDSLSLGCAKKYFFEPEYKAFEYLIKNPEESAKEILKYGLLKVQIEERKKAKALEKLQREIEEE